MAALRLAERLADVVHFHGHFSVIDDLHDVETIGRLAFLCDLRPIERGGARISALALEVDGLRGAAEPRIRPCLDLYEA